MTKNADLEFQYITLNAKNRRYGMVVKGIAYLKYGIVKNAGCANIFVPKKGDFGTYGLTIEDGNKNGVWAKNRGRLVLENTTVRNNAKAGIRSTSIRKVRIGNESVIHGNKYGLALKNHDNSKIHLEEATYKNNGKKLKKRNE